MVNRNRSAEREAERKRKLDEYVKRVVDAAPPLTAEQRDRLAVLLGGRGVAASDERALDEVVGGSR